MSHEFDTYAGQEPGYDGPLHAPHGAINPNNYAHGHDYQLALAGQHAADEYAAHSVGSRGPGGVRCPECEPLPAIGAGQAQRRRPQQLCVEHQRRIDIEAAREKAAYLRLPSVDEATFRRFLRGEAPHVVDGKTHHFYNWTGARVARLLAEALAEADPEGGPRNGTVVCLDGSRHRHVFLMPTGEVVTRRQETWRDSLGKIEVPYPPELLHPGFRAETHWTFYVRAQPDDRFNSRSHELLSDESLFVYKEINRLPGLVREARESVAARRASAEKARADEQARARQERRDNIRMVIYWILILAVVVAVVGGLVWASHAIPHR